MSSASRRSALPSSPRARWRTVEKCFRIPLELEGGAVLTDRGLSSTDDLDGGEKMSLAMKSMEVDPSAIQGRAIQTPCQLSGF